MIKLYRCPHATIGADIWAAVKASALLQVGILPRAGGWLDLPASFAEACKVIASECRKIDEESRSG